jgi:hypothetical protein
VALVLTYLKQPTVSPDTLVHYTCPTAKLQWQILLKTPIFNDQTAETSCPILPSEDTCCQLSLRCCSAPRGYSAGCRMSWVRLQHHATVETFNGVKMCDSKFLPNVSKLCQHQNRAVLNKHTRNVKCQQSQLS